MIKTTSKRKALEYLAELDENEKVVHSEVLCYKKTKRNSKTVTKQMVCRTEAQIENFYLPRRERATEETKHDRERAFANGIKKQNIEKESK